MDKISEQMEKPKRNLRNKKKTKQSSLENIVESNKTLNETNAGFIPPVETPVSKNNSCSNPLILYLSEKHTTRKVTHNAAVRANVSFPQVANVSDINDIPYIPWSDEEEIVELSDEIKVLSVKKKGPTIKPKQLRIDRDSKSQQNYNLIIESGGSLVPLRVNKPDKAWCHFKHLKFNGVVSKEIYCEICFTNGSLCKYSITSSLSVLKVHLNNKHDIQTKNPKMKTIKNMLGEGNSNGKSREEVILHLTIYFVMTQTPFHHIESQYTKDFLKYSGLLEDTKECPSQRSLSDNGLEKVFQFVQGEVKEQLKKAPPYITTAFDCWSDVARRHYYAIIMRFLTEDFEVKEYVVAFKKLMYKDAVCEAEAFTKVVDNYGLGDKKFIAVSDKGSDMVSLCKQLKMNRQDCIAHGLHNLINADVLPKTKVIKKLLKKLREILSCLRYRAEDLMVELQLEQDAAKAEYLASIGKIGK